MLQFEVLKERLKNEYKVNAALESAPFQVARWVAGTQEGLQWLKERSDFVLFVKDRDERWVVLSNSPWSLDYAVQQASGLELLDISPLDDRDLPSKLLPNQRESIMRLLLLPALALLLNCTEETEGRNPGECSDGADNDGDGY